MEYYIKAFKNFAKFKGRATRKEYWIFFLINIVILIIINIIDQIIGADSLLIFLYILTYSIPLLSLQVRRMHDVGKSGWILFIVLIPIIGFVWLLILLITDSEPGENRYGPNPKGINYTYQEEIRAIRRNQKILETNSKKDDVYSKVEKLNRLFNEGAITKEEFQREKDKIFKV